MIARVLVTVRACVLIGICAFSAWRLRPGGPPVSSLTWVAWFTVLPIALGITLLLLAKGG